MQSNILLFNFNFQPYGLNIRTTDFCGWFHSKFSSCLYSVHSNIIKFIDVLKGIWIKTYTKFRSTDILKKLKSKSNEIFIQAETEEFYNNEINRWLEFMKKNIYYTFLLQSYIIFIKKENLFYIFYYTF